MVHIRTLFLMVGAVLMGCSQRSTGPEPTSNSPQLLIVPGSVTLQVTNTSNRSFLVRGAPEFDPGFPQQETGVLTVGTVPPGTSCLRLPAEVDDIATHVPSGTVDTIRWFDDAPITLFVLGGTLQTPASTDRVVLNQSPGWTLHITAAGGVALAAGDACTP